MKTSLDARWHKEAMRREQVRAAKARREAIDGMRNLVTVSLSIDMSGFVASLLRVAESIRGRTALGEHYYRTRDGRIHRRAGHAPLLRNGGKP